MSEFNVFAPIPNLSQPVEPDFSVDAAKQALLGSGSTSTSTQQPTLSIDEAKEQLFRPAQPIPEFNSVTAKQALLGDTVQSKAELLANKSLEKKAKFGKLPTTGPALFGIPYEQLGTEAKVEAIRVAQQEKIVAQQQAEKFIREEAALISDEDVKTIPGYVGNLLLRGAAGATAVVGDTLTLGPRVLNAIGDAFLEEKDYGTYQVIQEKQATGVALTPEEQLFTKATTKDGRITQISKFDIIGKIESRENLIQSIEAGVASVRSRVNNKNTIEALNKLKENSDIAVKEFEEGEIFTGIGTVLEGIGTLAFEDTDAALELTVESLPQMYVLAKNAILGVSTLTAAGYDQALEDFEIEYGRAPDDSEKAIAGILSLASAGLDAVGAKAVFGLKQIFTGAKKIGIETAKVTATAAEKVVEQAATTTLKQAFGIAGSAAKKAAVNNITKAIVVEGLTEGAQNVLTQLAAKQDVSKIDIAEAITDLTVGAVSGKQISIVLETAKVVTKVPKVVSKTREVVHEVATKVVEKGTEAGIGKVDIVIAKAKETDKPELGIDAIANIKFANLDIEQRRTKINDLAELVAIHNVQTEDFTGTTEEIEQRKNENIEVNKTLQTVIQAHNKLAAGASVEDAISILNPTPEQRETISDEARAASVQTVITNIGSTTDLSPNQVTKILGSQDFKDNASSHQIKIVEDYKDYINKKAELEVIITDNITLGGVNDHVLNGSPDGKFKGINQHIADMEQAIALDDKVAAGAVIKALVKFGNNQQAKLNKKGNTKRFNEIVRSEVEAIRAALIQAKHMGIINFGIKSKVKSKPIPKVEPAVVESKVEKDSIIDLESSAYIKLIAKLDKINIEEEIEDSDGDIISTNVGTALENIDSRLNGLTQILKECG